MESLLRHSHCTEHFWGLVRMEGTWRGNIWFLTLPHTKKIQPAPLSWSSIALSLVIKYLSIFPHPLGNFYTCPRPATSDWPHSLHYWGWWFFWGKKTQQAPASRILSAAGVGRLLLHSLLSLRTVLFVPGQKLSLVFQLPHLRLGEGLRMRSSMK